MTNFSTPNSAVSGSSIASAEYNANWSAVETFLNSTGVPVLQDGAVSSAAKLASGVVEGAKLASTMSGDRTWSGVNTFSASPRSGVQTFTSAGSISLTGGELVSIGGATFDVTLPAATVGAKFTIIVGTVAGAIALVRAGSDTITTAGGTGSTSVSLNDRDIWQVVCVSAGVWHVLLLG